MRRFIALCAPAAAALLGVLAASPAVPSDRATTVRFPPGATSITLKGAIRGYSGVDYLFDARAGQTLQMLFSPSSRSCYFNVREPGASQAAHVGSFGSNEFGKTLALSGVYQAQVYLMRSAARRAETCRYSLSIEITGAPGGVSAGVSDQIMRDTCKGEAAQMYGVEPRRISPGVVTPDPTGFRIDSTADKGPEGVKIVALAIGPSTTSWRPCRTANRSRKGPNRRRSHWRRRSIEPCPVVTFLLALVECGLPLMRVAPS